ncbi:hypothetical protein EJB05_10560, partial [Eragrostis curvula]
MARIESLLLLFVTSICFFLVIAVAAQDVDEDRNYGIIANGTVTCNGKPSKDVSVHMTLEGRKTYESLGYGNTDRSGKFVIKVPKHLLRTYTIVRHHTPNYIMVGVYSTPKNRKWCPSGYKVDSYVKSRVGGGITTFEGARIFANGTRVYFVEGG